VKAMSLGTELVCLFNFSKTTLVSKIPLYRHGCLQRQKLASRCSLREHNRGSNLPVLFPEELI
jgi:hypothetical protein